MLALGRWGSRAPFPSDGEVFGADSVILALKTLFAPSAADGLSATYELRFGQSSFTARVDRGRFEVSRGEAGDADAAIRTDSSTLAGLLWHGRRLAPALRSGELELQGDRPVAERFLGLFPLPEPVLVTTDP